MFSSIAAFIFGSSTTEGTNCKPIEDSELHKSQNCYLTIHKQRKESLEEDSKNIETNVEYQQGIRNNNKRNNRKNKGKKPVLSKTKAVTKEPAPILDVVTSELSDVDFDLDDDWLLVQKDDVDIPNSFFRNDSKENLILAEHNNRTSTPISEILNITTVQQHNISNKSSQTLQNNCEKHKPDLTSGFSEASSGPTAVQLPPLSNLGYRPSESVVNVANKTRLLTDNNDTQLLHVANHSKDLEPNLSSVSIDSNGSGAKLFTMVDSWYMTPPPCFVSTGPIYMEMSPFENLLIEHPSMSIYHSIKNAQKMSESFVKFDLEVSESSQIQEEKENFYTQKSHEIGFVKPSTTILEQKTEPNIRKSAKTPRVDRCNAANLKMELFALNSQKSLAIYERRNLRRNAILRANQVREIQGRNNRQRRTDMQHSRVISGANNNRKCC
ncbi:uncharacterized protein T53i1 isoform X1 [Bactrocera dorsalis]|uniref:Uncharacterized protein T53i1 isoform X1 n=1 Tax=Bactrocera dorsalis TaxID=27457 RepID=A0A6I9VQJ0_BACDO|nr:uncharacterized protein T53i1 isoform X1 [Bactrocera dorsalis]XP_019846497.2 uncharacterized protein T53i1 isoform X1 [Bactrocera dorsalis]XP_019846498.2 uncharacterized protein T53i1 isoform X1 [Bactrocera dorsalis]XP_019846499.2 uncharacterized protein T53i1 isoform X1 [Bactrocera dorsalis]XP_019846500.2 uncharacterized protein T53i1 isoform X1 [Bactrocera dorsalis]XP_019846501.2 uncharacterized protein T53i1 isoform X1 [Bactrocera dorsalis]XP_049317765.1 uncharacterized protein T53i1 is